jgi:hypothetical protein
VCSSDLGDLYVARVRLRGAGGRSAAAFVTVSGQVADFDCYDYTWFGAVGPDWQVVEIPFVAVLRAPADHPVRLGIKPAEDGATLDLDEAVLARRVPGPRLLHREAFAAVDPAVWSAAGGWTVKKGTFVAPAGAGALLKAGAAWRDYTVAASLDVPRFGLTEAGIALRARDAAHQLQLVLVHDGDAQKGTWELRRVIGGAATVLASKPAWVDPVPWGQIQQFSIEARCRGAAVMVWVNGSLLFHVQEPALLAGTAGLVGLKGAATFTGFAVVKE